LAGVSLGGGDAALLASADQQNDVRGLGQRAGCLVSDPHGEGALKLGRLQHLDGVGRLAGLRNRYHQDVFQIHMGAVEREDGRRRQRDRYASSDLQKVAAELSSIVGRAPRREQDQSGPPGLQATAEALDARQGPAQGALQDRRLFQDFG